MKYFRPARFLAPALLLTAGFGLMGQAPAQVQEELQPAAAQTSTVRIVNQNVERRSNVIDAALAKAQAETAPIVLLQEVCSQDAARIRRDHPDWLISFRQNGTVARYCPDASGERQLTGDIAIWRGGNEGAVRSLTFNNQTEAGVHGMACVLYNTVYRACSTHFTAADQDIAAKQALEVKRYTNDWITAGAVVVVGGDLNMNPEKDGLNYLYAYGQDAQGTASNGRFIEVTRNGQGNAYRGGQYTNTVRESGFKRKIDYVFVSESVSGTSSPATLERIDRYGEPVGSGMGSDHVLMYATARVVIS